MYEFKGLNEEQMTAVRVDALMRFSNQHSANLAAAEEAAKLREVHEAANLKVMEKILAENEAKAIADAEELRRTSAKNLEIQLRQQYFEVNQNALESDFQRDLPTMKQNYFLAKLDGKKVENLIRNSGNYARM
jgi:hypothetical protein